MLPSLLRKMARPSIPISRILVIYASSGHTILLFRRKEWQPRTLRSGNTWDSDYIPGLVPTLFLFAKDRISRRVQRKTHRLSRTHSWQVIAIPILTRSLNEMPNRAVSRSDRRALFSFLSFLIFVSRRLWMIFIYFEHPPVPSPCGGSGRNGDLRAC